MSDAGGSRRRRVLRGVLGWAFVAAALTALVVGFRDDGPALLRALATTEPWTVLLAAVGAVVAVAALLPIWRGLLAASGHRLPWIEAARILSVGQLGKYLPGSVWSVGAQAALLRRHAVPVRVALGVGALLVVSQLAGAAVVVASVGFAGAGVLGPVPIVAAVVLVAVAACLVPAVLRRILRLATGVAAHLPPRAWGVVVGALLLGWAVQTLAIVPLATGAGWTAATPQVVAAFAAAYAGGVVVVLAPAGIGVREGVLAALLAPTIGPGPALATALVTRVAAAVVDVAAAAATTWVARRRRE